MTLTELPTITPAAQADLDAANALFPGRYALRALENRFVGLDLHSGKTTRVGATQEDAAKYLLMSARLSANNGNRRHAHGTAPTSRSLTLRPDEWARLEREAQEAGLSLPDLMRARLLP